MGEREIEDEDRNKSVEVRGRKLIEERLKLYRRWGGLWGKTRKWGEKKGERVIRGE